MESIIISKATEEGFGTEALRLLSLAGMNHSMVDVVSVETKEAIADEQQPCRDILL